MPKYSDKESIALSLLIFLAVYAITYNSSNNYYQFESHLKTSPVVRDFLADYPNSTAITKIIPAGNFFSQMEQMKKYCPDFSVSSYYKTAFYDLDSGANLVVWTDAFNLKLACAILEKSGVKTFVVAANTTLIQSNTIGK